MGSDTPLTRNGYKLLFGRGPYVFTLTLGLMKKAIQGTSQDRNDKKKKKNCKSKPVTKPTFF